jgi:Hint domain
MKKMLVFAIVALFLSGCASNAPTTVPGGGFPTPIEITAEVSTVLPETPGPPPTEGPSPTPVPATPIPTLPSSSFSPSELKYMVLAQYPDFFFCDPDFYPIAREDESVLAKQRFPELQANQEEFQAILKHTNISGKPYFTDQQRLTIYREHKKLSAIPFQLVGETYQFQIQTGAEGQQGSLITGTIDANGAIEIQKQESTFPSCPICLAVGTLIETPRGAVPVEDLQLGDPVWTMNAAGERVPGKILKLGNVNVPATHHVIHLVLSDRRELWASPGHPTADGQRLSDVKVDDWIDGARVILVERLPYAGSKTYDLLPSGETGFYWANGILLGSTLVDHR